MRVCGSWQHREHANFGENGASPDYNAGLNVSSPHVYRSSGRVVLVTNLPTEVSPGLPMNADNLFHLFRQYGIVERVKILYNKRDTALVQYSDPASAQRAINVLSGLPLAGGILHLAHSKHEMVTFPTHPEAVHRKLTMEYVSHEILPVGSELPPMKSTTDDEEKLPLDVLHGGSQLIVEDNGNDSERKISNQQQELVENGHENNCGSHEVVTDVSPFSTQPPSSTLLMMLPAGHTEKDILEILGIKIAHHQLKMVWGMHSDNLLCIFAVCCVGFELPALVSVVANAPDVPEQYMSVLLYFHTVQEATVAFLVHQQQVVDGQRVHIVFVHNDSV